MKYGDRFSHTIKLTKATRISFALEAPIATQPAVNALDSLPTTTSKSIAITKGLVYTVLLDGTKKNELQMRLVSTN
ncbi:hypothetical protein G7074_17650 [Pedobacter sp. HDW13]|nr:hypothetical protein [Pedobacter sp. HDW13]QIL40928.1 hypothetical protein G7074_17650 [Pedobacter sp. HDW13]